MRGCDWARTKSAMPRIVTYNVRRCVGLDRRLDVGRIAEVIARLNPEIVALQELDVGRARTNGVDQAHEIARRLAMNFHFNAAIRVEEEQYGDAILTSLPERLVRAGPLPRDPRLRALESRGALWVSVEIAGRKVQILNTHFGLLPREQQLQARGLTGPRWLGHADCAGPVILAGDFNAAPGSAACRRLAGHLDPAWRRIHRSAPPPHLSRRPADPAHRPPVRQRGDRGSRRLCARQRPDKDRVGSPSAGDGFRGGGHGGLKNRAGRNFLRNNAMHSGVNSRFAVCVRH